MAIYTRMGAPVRIVEAEQRRRWWIHYGNRTKIFDKPPTAAQRNRAKDESEFDIWWIKAVIVGAYPDGSGADRIGKLHSYGGDGWLDENEFVADDGIRELHRECEMKRDDKLAA